MAPFPDQLVHFTFHTIYIPTCQCLVKTGNEVLFDGVGTISEASEWFNNKILEANRVFVAAWV